MNKSCCVILAAFAMLAACQTAPKPPPAVPTVPAAPTINPSPTAAATRAPTPTPSPTIAPTVAPTTAPTAAPATPTATPVLQVQVNSSDVGYLNIRDTPSTSGALVVQVKDGDTLDVLDAADTARGQVGQQGQWLKVRTSDGKEGYAAAWYLRLPGTSPAPALQPTAIPVTPDLAGAELDLFNRTNALRAQNGLAAYRNADRLNAAAQRQSNDMANLGQVSDTGSDGSTVRQRVLDTGYGDYPVAEDVYGGVVTLDDVWRFWSTDPAQRDALLSQQFHDVGVSAVKGKSGTFYYTIVFGAQPSAPEAPPAPTPGGPTDAVQNLLDRTNALRAMAGLPPYRLSSLLNASAERHSQDMASTGNIDHTGSDKSTPKQRILDTGYEAQFTGEDIYGGMVTVDDAWNYWSTDPPHRDTLLDQHYTEIGISVVKGKGGWFYFTMDLARPTPP